MSPPIARTLPALAEEHPELLRLRFRVFNLELAGGSRSRSAPAAISIRSTPSAIT